MITTGKFNLDLIFFINADFFADLLKQNLKYLGVKILFLRNIFFEISLSIAIEEGSTPECVYFIFSDSNIDCIYPSSPYLPCNVLNTTSGLNDLIFLIKSPFGSQIFVIYFFLFL